MEVYMQKLYVKLPYTLYKNLYICTMKRDIPIRKVKNVAIAILPEGGQLDAEIWEVYIINLKLEPIEQIIVNSKGFGTKNGSSVKTSTLRQHFERIEPQTCLKLELLQPELFSLSHEFWVSFLYDGFLFDKKYTFVKGSLEQAYFTQIPIIERPGVMIV